jgi:DNA-binding IclR family transcriptional regulator
MSRTPRSDQDYAIDAGLRLLKVLEALEGTQFEPVSIQRVAERTGFTYDFCMRALRTLKIAGFATQNDRGLWAVGPKLLRFSKEFYLYCLMVAEGQSSGISER